jgi:ADP-heptose:LPS heptosyltransferase
MEKCHMFRPSIEKNKLAIKPCHAIVIFPGASSNSKKWPVGHFYGLCHRIYRELSVEMIVVPGKDEAPGSDFGCPDIPAASLRVAGNLDMEALCSLIGGAAVLISGDTVAIHIAAALDIPAVCICKGDLFGRFVPYPANVFDKLFCVLPRSLRSGDLRYDQWSPAKIGEVDEQDVFDAVLKALSLKNVI